MNKSAMTEPQLIDPTLPNLPFVLDRHRMTVELAPYHGLKGRWQVTAVEILKHKKGKRCSLAFLLQSDDGELTRLFGKLFRTERGAGIFHQMDRFHQALHTSSLIVPRPVGYLAERRLLVTEYLDGTDFAAEMYTGRSLEPVRRMAAALAELHASSAACPRRWAPRKEIRNTADWLAGLAGRKPARSERAWSLLDRLTRYSTTIARKLEFPIHRDCYPEQFWNCDDGVALLDLDDVRSGDPATDIGNFLAHLILRPMQYPATAAGCDLAALHFVEAWIEEVGSRFDPGQDFRSRVRFYTATTLVRLAGVYAARERWAETVPELLLDACVEIVDEGSIS